MKPICFQGETLSVEEWAKRIGITRESLRDRLATGWSVEEALTKPRTEWKRFKTKHAKEYRTWSHMKGRCYDPNDKFYPSYGGRGIKVCEEWGSSFESFLENVGLAPTPKHTLDRINTHDDYKPGNVRWATQTEQARNRTNNWVLEHNGAKKSMAEWCEIFAINRDTVRQRLKMGWSIEEAFTTKVKHKVRG